MKKILFLAAMTVLWTSCATDDDSCNPKSPDKISVSASIATLSLNPDSRTAISGSTAAWINGDAIGVYCTQSTPAAVNDSFTVSGIGTTPVWTPATAIYWIDGVTAHKFLAYAPYTSGNTDPTAVKLPAIGTQTGTIAPAQDFLISNNLNTSGTARIATVGLVFTHALSLIELDVVLGAGLATGTTLTNVIIAGGSGEKLYNTDASSTISLSSGAITAGTGTNTATVTPASAPTLSGTATPIYVLLLPGTYTAPSLTVNIKEAGTTALTTATIALGNTLFEAGKKYTFTATVSRTIITLSNPTITDWTVVPGTPITPGI